MCRRFFGGPETRRDGALWQTSSARRAPAAGGLVPLMRHARPRPQPGSGAAGVSRASASGGRTMVACEAARDDTAAKLLRERPVQRQQRWRLSRLGQQAAVLARELGVRPAGDPAAPHATVGWSSSTTRAACWAGDQQPGVCGRRHGPSFSGRAQLAPQPGARADAPARAAPGVHQPLSCRRCVHRAGASARPVPPVALDLPGQAAGGARAAGSRRRAGAGRPARDALPHAVGRAARHAAPDARDEQPARLGAALRAWLPPDPHALHPAARARAARRDRARPLLCGAAARARRPGGGAPRQPRVRRKTRGSNQAPSAGGGGRADQRRLGPRLLDRQAGSASSALHAPRTAPSAPHARDPPPRRAAHPRRRWAFSG